MPLKKIFFSYSRQDGSEFSLRLATDLKQRGFNVWIDQQDIRAGTEWDLEVEKALETCDCLLFIETEKSVISNNVLDEVYYALGQNKKVIPLIVVDSKTPFRIQRIQHIDFTNGYDEGLKKLIQALQNEDAGTNTFVTTSQIVTSQKTFLRKYAGWLIVVLASLIVLIAVLWYNKDNRPTLTADANNTTGDEPAAAGDNDTNNNSVVMTDTPTVRSGKKQAIPAETKAADKKAESKIIRRTELDLAALEGEWYLKDVDLKTRSSDGYLKIESIGDKKINIKSALRFFYIKPKDTAYLSIFNAFVGCKNCALEEEIKLAVEDIALGSQVYSILKHDQEGIGKAGDTIMDKGGNKSIRGTAVLQFNDNKTAFIKILRSTPVDLDGGLVVKPFEYLFTFKKND